MLRRNCEKVVIGYDSDGAGQAATLRGLEILYNLGCDIRILQIEGAKDPDEFVVKYGPEKFQKCVENAISLVEFKVKMLKKNLNLENVNDKIKFLNETAKILSKVENNIEREVYIDKISKEYKISKEAIYADVNKLSYENQKSKDSKIIKNVKTIVKGSTLNQVAIEEKVEKREKLIIYLLLNYPNKVYSSFKDIITMNLIQSEKNKKIISKLYEEYEKGNINIDKVLEWFEDEEVINYLSSIMVSDSEILDLDKSIQDIINSYKKENLINQRNSILEKLEDSTSLTNEETTNLENSLNEVIIKLAKMK